MTVTGLICSFQEDERSSVNEGPSSQLKSSFVAQVTADVPQHDEMNLGNEWYEVLGTHMDKNKNLV